jgi:hypothetical protein
LVPLSGVPDGNLQPAQELGIYGRLRKIERCGPVLMFRKLLVEWRNRYSPSVIAEHVQAFFRCSRFASLNSAPATVEEQEDPECSLLLPVRYSYVVGLLPHLIARHTETPSDSNSLSQLQVLRHQQA